METTLCSSVPHACQQTVSLHMDSAAAQHGVQHAYVREPDDASERVGADTAIDECMTSPLAAAALLAAGADNSTRAQKQAGHNNNSDGLSAAHGQVASRSEPRPSQPGMQQEEQQQAAASALQPALRPRAQQQLPSQQRPTRKASRVRLAASMHGAASMQQHAGRGGAVPGAAAAAGEDTQGGQQGGGFVLVAKALTKSDTNGRVILPRVMVETNLPFLMGYRCA